MAPWTGAETSRADAPRDVGLVQSNGGFPMATVKELARDMAQAFEVATRAGGDADDTYTRLRDGSPEWMRDVVYAAHGDMLPDDWRYATIAAAVEHIADADDPEDDAWQFADDAVDVYTGARIEWLGSHGARPGYVDAAAEEFGAAEDVTAAIGRGQYLEAQEIYSAVLSALEARADDDEEDEDEEDDED